MVPVIHNVTIRTMPLLLCSIKTAGAPTTSPRISRAPVDVTKSAQDILTTFAAIRMLASTATSNYLMLRHLEQQAPQARKRVARLERQAHRYVVEDHRKLLDIHSVFVVDRQYANNVIVQSSPASSSAVQSSTSMPPDTSYVSRTVYQTQTVTQSQGPEVVVSTVTPV
jgi:hypothetical protein